MRQLSAAHQQLAVFCAALQAGDDFAGVEQAFGVKGVFDAEHLCVFVGGKLHAHAVEFFDAHAVFAGDRAAHGHAGFEDVGTKEFAAAHLLGVAGVKQNEGVQVAVSGVKDVGAAQLVFGLHFGNGQQHVGQAFAWDGAVHAHVVGADAA